MIDVVFQPEASALMFKTYHFSFDISLWSSYILEKNLLKFLYEEQGTKERDVGWVCFFEIGWFFPEFYSIFYSAIIFFSIRQNNKN